MALKYHINAKGEPAVCRASERPCPIGGDHFDNVAEAYESLAPTGGSFGEPLKKQEEIQDAFFWIVEDDEVETVVPNERALEKDYSNIVPDYNRDKTFFPRNRIEPEYSLKGLKKNRDFLIKMSTLEVIRNNIHATREAQEYLAEEGKRSELYEKKQEALEELRSIVINDLRETVDDPSVAEIEYYSLQDSFTQRMNEKGFDEFKKDIEINSQEYAESIKKEIDTMYLDKPNIYVGQKASFTTHDNKTIETVAMARKDVPVGSMIYDEVNKSYWKMMSDKGVKRLVPQPRRGYTQDTTGKAGEMEERVIVSAN